MLTATRTREQVAVEKGIMFLTQEGMLGALQQIDLDELEICDSSRCVLALTYCENYDTVWRRLGMTEGQSFDLGFCCNCSMSTCSGELLNIAWREAIGKLRE